MTEKPKPCPYDDCPHQRPCPVHSVSVTRNGVTDYLYCPNSKQQVAFHAATEANVIMEGSRGGGKSHCMRWDAYVRCITTPDFKVLILRRKMPDLRQSHLIYVDHETQRLTGEKCYNRAEFTAVFPNHSRVVFGHCEDDSAVERYLSSEWDAIYFDELVTFELRQFMLISASARGKSGTNRVALVRGGTNPVGIGATWVKEFFIDKNPDPEVAPDYIPADWRAIKVNLDDNPDVDQDNYHKRLVSLPTEALRRAYRYGEWVTEGTFFDEFREKRDGQPWHVIDEMPTIMGTPVHRVPWVEIVRAMDWGFSDREPGIVQWYACLPDGTAICFKEFVFHGMTPKEVAKETLKRSEGMKVRYTTGDPMMWQARQGETIAETMARNGLSMIPAENERENGWVRMHSWLIETVNDGTGERPRIQFLRGSPGGALGCPHTIKAIPSAQTKENNPHDLEGPFEDPLDTARYFVMSRPSASKRPRVDGMSKELRRAIYGGNAKRHVLGSSSVRA